jgi:hypothetical protein
MIAQTLGLDLDPADAGQYFSGCQQGVIFLQKDSGELKLAQIYTPINSPAFKFFSK